MNTYRITPELRTVAYLATFSTPVSHHDAGQHDSSNRSLFRREKKVVRRPVCEGDVTQRVAEVIALFDVPEGYADLYRELTEDEFLAVALMHEFIVAYSTEDGLGLFSGPERYRRLEDRAVQRAIRSHNIFQWWGGMAHDLQVGLPLYGDKSKQSALLGLPLPVALRVLRTLAENATSAIMLARVWREVEHDRGQLVRVEPQSGTYQTSDAMVLDVPAVSANSIRHEMVREPGALHLLTALGLTFDELPLAVARMLYNGGDLNESAPDSAFSLARQIRQAYPLLSLIGGTTNGFILGASNLDVRAWLVGDENNAALSRYGIQTSLSLFDLLDEHEHTRHTNKRVEGSPMPFSFEALAGGAQVLIEFVLRPYATALEFGALLAALRTYWGADSTLFGSAARGYGLLNAEVLAMPDGADKALAQYEAHLADNAEVLRAGLLDGTLTTARVVVS